VRAILERAWFYQAIMAWLGFIDKLLSPLHGKKSSRLRRVVVWLVLFPLLHGINSIGWVVLALLFCLLAPIDLFRLILYWLHEERRIRVTGE
jgi:hypothetical protein